jgi:two-component system OmpR family response regulator
MELQEHGDDDSGRAQAGPGLVPVCSRARRVLVADDEQSLRMLCRLTLELEGMVVAEAADGREALAAARTWQPDAILLDITMPVLSGWEVAERLLADEATERMAIIFFSAHAGLESRIRGIEIGGIGYVTKPFDPQILAPMIEESQRLKLPQRAAFRRAALAELREAS